MRHVHSPQDNAATDLPWPAADGQSVRPGTAYDNGRELAPSAPTPRRGSSIDRAVQALRRDGPLARESLAKLIERDHDEVDDLLRYGVRLGLLARTAEGGNVVYSLGDGKPPDVEDCAPRLPGGASTLAPPAQPVGAAPAPSMPQAAARLPLSEVVADVLAMLDTEIAQHEHTLRRLQQRRDHMQRLARLAAGTTT